jgi:hypothetical protein
MRQGEPGEDAITVVAALEALAELIDNPVIVRAC